MSTVVPARPAVAARAAARPLAQGLMVASGAAGLGWQLVWTRQCGLWLGHEAPAILAVMAAFFGGLALGAALLGGRVARSTAPWRAYALCEGVVALWGAVLLGIIGPTSDTLRVLIGPEPQALWQWAVAFIGSLLLLAPATMAMGATLPAMAHLAALLTTPADDEPGARARVTAALYAANTAGAFIGVLATAFWLLPGWGLQATGLVCAGLNLACAAGAWRLRHGRAPGPMTGRTAARVVGARLDGRPLVRLLATGTLGVGYEVLVVRVLSQVCEDTVYTYALLLAVYLVGTALGAALWARAGRLWATDRDWLVIGLAAAVGLGMVALWQAEALKTLWLAAGEASGAPPLGLAVGAEAWLALLAFGPATLAMGALFSRLVEEAQGAGASLGVALGVNTLGAALAPPLFGVALAGAVGSKAALIMVVLGYLLLLGPALVRRPLPILALASLAAAAVLAPPLAFVNLPEDGRLVEYREGLGTAVSVVASADGTRTLRIDNRQQEGSSATARVDGRQALLPLLLHAQPHRALFLGLGTGVTAATAAADPGVAVTAVELLPEVIAAAHLFDTVVPAGSARLRTVAADARRYVRTSDAVYDVIVADNFHPARSGAGLLYTVEHFQAVKSRLAPGGLFCQWLPLHQLDLDTLRSIVRSFLAVNPQAVAMLAHNGLLTPVIGLVGWRDGAPALDLDRLGDRQARLGQVLPLGEWGLADRLAVAGSIAGDADGLARFANGAPLNTDDLPRVAWRAPRITYVPDSSPAERLLALLTRLGLPSPAVVVTTDGPAPRAALVAYWQARQRFLEAGRRIVATPDPVSMLAQVRGPLLEVLRTSPDFLPARQPLERLADALSAPDPAMAAALRDEITATSGTPR